MTELPSRRLFSALQDLEEIRQERNQSVQDDARFQRIHDTLTYLLHCMTGDSHDGEHR